MSFMKLFFSMMNLCQIIDSCQQLNVIDETNFFRYLNNEYMIVSTIIFVFSIEFWYCWLKNETWSKLKIDCSKFKNLKLKKKIKYDQQNKLLSLFEYRMHNHINNDFRVFNRILSSIVKKREKIVEKSEILNSKICNC